MCRKEVQEFPNNYLLINAVVVGSIILYICMYNCQPSDNVKYTNIAMVAG